MCGGGQATGSTASATATVGGMMCGAVARPAAATDPMTETRSPSQQSAQSGCPCCRMMAMMGGGSGGGMGGMMGGGSPTGSMPGMPGMTPRPQ